MKKEVFYGSPVFICGQRQMMAKISSQPKLLLNNFSKDFQSREDLPETTCGLYPLSNLTYFKGEKTSRLSTRGFFSYASNVKNNKPVRPFKLFPYKKIIPFCTLYYKECKKSSHQDLKGHI